ncbi:MAG TPA: cupin domain-containing protein [Alphaproteobacteria bacterium]|nr:cupin domain-containing protein [Alphaproteobacteria bacterium]
MSDEIAAADGPYVFHASRAPSRELGPGVTGKAARMPDGLVVRYQERAPGHDGDHWCESGHTAYILAGRIRYEFADQAVEAGPGDIVHIPAGHAHRHRPRVVGSEPVRYFITEFWD